VDVMTGFMFLPTIILVVIGVSIKYFKAYWLISGYNTLSSEKKKNVDIEGLANFAGNLCLVMAGIIGLAGVLMLEQKMVAAGIFFVLLFPLSIYSIVKSQQYDGNTRQADGTMTRNAKWKIGLPVALLLIAGVGVGVLFYQSSQPIATVLTQDYLEIKGLYGEKIAWTEITEVALIAEIPQITARTNGASLGEKKRGNFRLKDVGAAKLFLETSNPPFIYIEREQGKPIIINLIAAETTRDLHQDLFTTWQKAQGTEQQNDEQQNDEQQNDEQQNDEQQNEE
jgi:hypothetical protein